jgi:hypothetical protein
MDISSDRKITLADVKQLKDKTLSDEDFFAKTNVLRNKPIMTPQHLSVSSFKTPFKHREILDVDDDVFVALFPLFNARAPLVIRRNGDVFRTVEVLKANLDLAELITNIDSVDYHAGGGQDVRPEIALLKLCPNVRTITLGVHIDDCLESKVLDNGRMSRRSRTLDEYLIKQKYQLTPIRKAAPKLKATRIRLRGTEIMWKYQFAEKMLISLAQRFEKDDAGRVTVLDLGRFRGMVDPYMWLDAPTERDIVEFRPRVKR